MGWFRRVADAFAGEARSPFPSTAASERRADLTPEQRAALTPAMALRDPALAGLFGGSSTASGVVVTEHTARNISAVHCAVNVLASAVAGLPLILYHRTPGGGRERAESHPLYHVLHDAFSPRHTSYVARETLMGHVLLWGNCYCEIVRDDAGVVRSLWPITPDRVEVKVTTAGAPVYVVHRPGQPDLHLGAADVLHVPGPGYDGLMGASIIQLARESLGLSVAAERYGARFFSNNATPAGVLSSEHHLSPAAQADLRTSWEGHLQGTDRAHRIAILTGGGLTWSPLSMPNRDAEFMGLREFEIIEIARFFNVPPFKLHDMRHSAVRANVEHAALEFVTNTLRPWLIRWEQAINQRLLGPGPYFVEHLVDGLLRGDTLSRYQALMIGRQGGWLSVNDVRAIENMSPIAGGDTYLSPLNMTPAGTLPSAVASNSDSDRSYAASERITLADRRD